MSTTTAPPPPPAPPGNPVGPADLVAAARERLGELDDLLLAARTSRELLDLNTELERARSQIAAAQVRVAVEIEATEAAKTVGYASTKDYLTHVSGGRAGAGNRILKTARAVTGELVATWQALRTGEVSPEQVEVIVRSVERLPVDPAVRLEAEGVLIGEAGRLNATDLAKAGEHVLEVVDPDGVAAALEQSLLRDERSAHLSRGLSITDDGLGGVRLRGRGTIEDAAIIKTALLSLSAPMAAALADTDPGCGEEVADVRDHGARSWDALVEVCRRVHDADVLPEDHGARTRVIVTLDHDALVTGLGTGTVLNTGQPLSAAAIRKLACDADLIPAVLGSRGEILDVGRTQRLVTTAIWLLLVLRDRHCAFPGCRRPPVACDAHHIRHWADGGPTSLLNLVLLCRAHHSVIHHTGWQIRINPADGRPEFRPPPGRHRITPELLDTLAASGPPLSSGEPSWLRERSRHR